MRIHLNVRDERIDGWKTSMRGVMMQMNNDMVIGEALINELMVTMILMTIIEREQELQIHTTLLIDATQVRWLSWCVDASN